MWKSQVVPHFMGECVGSSYKTGFGHGYGFIGRTEISAGSVGIVDDVYIECPSDVMVSHHPVTVGLIVVVIFRIIDVFDRVLHKELNPVFEEILIQLT